MSSAAEAASVSTGASAGSLLLAWLIARVTGHSSGCYPDSRVLNVSDPLLLEVSLRLDRPTHPTSRKPLQRAPVTF